MNPLSSIHPSALSEVRMAALAQRASNATSSPIPAAEIQKLASAQTTEALADSKATNASFGQMLSKLVDEVNTQQFKAQDTVGQLMSGGNVSLHQAMITMEEANVSFQLMVEVRNKLLESYQELMRMQV